MAQTFPSHMDEEKSPTRARMLHKIFSQVALIIDGAASPETMRLVDQGLVVVVLRALHHARWWQALDFLPIKKAETNMTYEII